MSCPPLSRGANSCLCPRGLPWRRQCDSGPGKSPWCLPLSPPSPPSSLAPAIMEIPPQQLTRASSFFQTDAQCPRRVAGLQFLYRPLAGTLRLFPAFCKHSAALSHCRASGPTWATCWGGAPGRLCHEHSSPGAAATDYLSWTISPRPPAAPPPCAPPPARLLRAASVPCPPIPAPARGALLSLKCRASPPRAASDIHGSPLLWGTQTL